jgi:thiol-disulfide isomerase/thioredoxin
MILKVFTQPKCPKCPAAKALARQLAKKNLTLKIEFYDTTTVNGLAEASFYSVMGTPSLVLTDKRGQEISGWRGETPTLKKILAKLK